MGGDENNAGSKPAKKDCKNMYLLSDLCNCVRMLVEGAPCQKSFLSVPGTEKVIFLQEFRQESNTKHTTIVQMVLIKQYSSIKIN